jgi:hypothetical protein
MKSKRRIVIYITIVQLMFVEVCFCNLKPLSNISILPSFVYCHLQDYVLGKGKLGPLQRVCVCVCACARARARARVFVCMCVSRALVA